MSDDEEFTRRLRERVDATVPVIPVATSSVVPRARRRRAVTRSVGTLAAVAVLGGAVWTAGAFWPGRTTSPPVGGATSAASASAAQRTGLFGMWRVDAEGEGADTWLRLAGSSSAMLWRDCGVLTGGWAVGSTAFVSYLSSWSGTCGDPSDPRTAPWLDASVAYRADGDGWQLLDATGAVTATLRHDGAPQPRSDMSAEYARPPVVDDAARYWVSDPAPLRDGLVPATRDQVVGRWIATGSPVATDPYVVLSDDSTWTGSDGCNVVTGRWALDTEGWFVVVSGPSTAMGCDGAPLPDLLVTARRLATSGDDLLLFDDEGAQVGQLTRDGPAPTALMTPGASRTPDPDTTTAAASATVTCRNGELVVPPGPIVATSAGVGLVVQNDGAPAGTYLNYRWSGGLGGGDELPTTPADWWLPVPPGTFEVSCSSDLGRTEWGRATLTVTDPDGWWRAGTPQSLGCPGSAYLDVPAPPLGDHWVTARQAVQAWFTVLHRPGTLTAEPAPIGYPDAPSQTWLVSEDGKPYVAMTVTDPGGGFVASADLLCAAS